MRKPSHWITPDTVRFGRTPVPHCGCRFRLFLQLKEIYTYEVSPLDWNGKPGRSAALTVAMPQSIEKTAPPPKPELPLSDEQNNR